MADATHPGTGAGLKGAFAQLDLDPRLLGMIGAVLFVGLGFNIATGGLFLTPRNIFNLTIQTVSVAIMATGMVFVIVTRNIDLSVGSLLATCSAVMAMTQTVILPDTLGLGLNHPVTMPVTLVVGIICGAAIGGFQGWLIGYRGIPAFIVTLGGLLLWRNVAWYITTGQTIGPLDENIVKLGGIGGTLGSTGSWIVGILAVLASWGALWGARRAKLKHGFLPKPLWAEAVVAGLIALVILGFVAILNTYQVPQGRLERIFEARGDVMPEGYTEGYGLPYSFLLLIAIAIGMTVIGRRTRLGRYIYAMGGNPDATDLAGIDTRFLTVKVFALMGSLAALAGVVAAARLNFHSNDIGTLDELRVIAAAVIGGTALSGGIGTIHGAILGALIMQSLQSGMAMVGVDAPLQNIVVGGVLILAVWVDIVYRKRVGA